MGKSLRTQITELETQIEIFEMLKSELPTASKFDADRVQYDNKINQLRKQLATLQQMRIVDEMDEDE